MARSSAATKLAKYRSMRDFEETPEPSGGEPRPGQGRSFVIQKHAARRLHYDFRLEHEGVLWSWSVPKGPSLSPTERRLAVRTEDHPLDYADFEGIIPPGQYGSGTVVVWDHGTWEPEGDPGVAIKKGRLTFTLRGEKLAGRWHLVKTRGAGKQEQWLLFKGRDEAASDTADVVAEHPESVLSGRTLEEVAEAPARTWQSNRKGSAPAAAAPARAPAAAATPKVSAKAAGADLHGLVAQLPLGFALTNLDKVLFPEQGLTKGELIAYLAVVAEHMLPHVANRPLTLVRCPEGRGKPCFFQKHVLPGSPPAIHRVPIEEVDGETALYMAIEDMPGLVALAQLGTLEIHTWGSHIDKPERPDLMVFDLDPDVGLAWDQVALGALELRRRLRELGLESFVKTTGGKGLHVAVPIERRLDWDDFKAFTKAVVEGMERDEPERYTTNMGKVHRRGKVFLDYLRNGRNATFVAPYSVRARPGAPVAVPITWDELARGIDPAAFDTRTVPRRLGELREDPWRDIDKIHQSITAAAWRAVGGTPARAIGSKPARAAAKKPRARRTTTTRGRRAA
ncbi:MAG TPA: non-homologous end-joining DNA ligase [Kofleriaceae bacterium]|nr:non-homologous end-joining DNA ligase [Kofleriaceae bacterium]